MTAAAIQAKITITPNEYLTLRSAFYKAVVTVGRHRASDWSRAACDACQVDSSSQHSEIVSLREGLLCSVDDHCVIVQHGASELVFSEHVCMTRDLWERIAEDEDGFLKFLPPQGRVA